MLLLANLFWGLSFPLIKSIGMLHGVLLPGVGTWFSACYTVAPRFLLAVLVLVALRPRGFWRVTRGELKQGGVIGLFLAGGMLLQNDGLQFVPASTSAFLTQLYAILIPVWLALRARRSPGWLVWACCALVLAGVAILGRFDWGAMRFLLESLTSRSRRILIEEIILQRIETRTLTAIRDALLPRLLSGEVTVRTAEKHQ